MVGDVNSIINTTAASNQVKGKDSLGKDDFFRLMITQLKNQDPLNPTDGTQFSAQLAQFSSLEQLSNMNDALKQSLDANYLLAQSVNNTMAVSLIGKEIKLNGGSIKYNGENSIVLGYDLPADARTVTVDIYDSQGTLVKSFEQSSISSGVHKLSWDFTDNNGNKLQTGSYKFEVNAKDYNNSEITAGIFKMGLINSVRYTEQGTKVLVGNTEYDLSDISEIFGTETNGGK